MLDLSISFVLRGRQQINYIEQKVYQYSLHLKHLSGLGGCAPRRRTINYKLQFRRIEVNSDAKLFVFANCLSALRIMFKNYGEFCFEKYTRFNVNFFFLYTTQRSSTFEKSFMSPDLLTHKLKNL